MRRTFIRLGLELGLILILTQAEYDDLESDYNATAGRLNSYTTYTYILAIVTVIFVITTIVFAARKSVW